MNGIMLLGLTLGIGLRQRGIPVTVLEAGHYPRHRVCGEFSCPDIASYLLGISVIVFEDIYHMFLRITRARARMTPCPTFYPPTTLATVLDSSRGTAIAP